MRSFIALCTQLTKNYMHVAVDHCNLEDLMLSKIVSLE